MTKRIMILLFGVVWLLTTGQAVAQEAPTPRKLPRVPVSQQYLNLHKEPLLVSRNVSGLMTIIDSENLKMGGINLRFFGIVPPQLSANYGPQARALLDALTAGSSLDCQIRDRDHEGHFLATCLTANKVDPALELLKQGLAVAARGSLAGTELAAPYMLAEQGAQADKKGLWSTTPVFANTSVAAPPNKDNSSPSLGTVQPLAESKKDIALSSKGSENTNTNTTPLAASESGVKNVAKSSSGNTNFFGHYQLLLTGLVMLLTALSISSVLVIQRRMERRDEMKAIAAALRGELMAARALCQGRLKAIVTEMDDKATAWPRIRSTLYQAYVGRIGWLGADLARQVVSLYGQSSDYAAYYQSSDDMYGGSMPKRHALQILVHHIEEVLPKLALIEQTGERLKIKSVVSSQPKPPVSSPPVLNNSPRPMASLAAPPDLHKADTKADTVVSLLPPLPLSPIEEKIVPKVVSTSRAEKTPDAVVDKSEVNTKDERNTPSTVVLEKLDHKENIQEPLNEVLANLARLSDTASPSEKKVLTIDPSLVEEKGSEKETSTGVPLWSAMRKFARDHLPEKASPSSEFSLMDEAMPDYVALIEEDMSHFSFSENDDDLDEDTHSEPLGHLGHR